MYKANLPYMPEWIFLRPNIKKNYLIPGFDKIGSSNVKGIQTFRGKNRMEEVKKLGLMTNE